MEEKEIFGKKKHNLPYQWNFYVAYKLTLILDHASETFSQISTAFPCNPGSSYIQGELQAPPLIPKSMANTWIRI